MRGGFISRLERFRSVDSTQRIVREWLEDGSRGVCVAVADEQTQGRGRQGRDWSAPVGAALLVSAGFTPRHLPLAHAWRLAATAALAMLDAGEDVAGLRDGTLWLKWPNDLVADGTDGRLLKVAGVLGEIAARAADAGSLADAVIPADSHGRGTEPMVAHAVIGLGVNADWAAADFPPHLADSMTSLRELSGGRPIDAGTLLDAWLLRLEPRMEALEAGSFDAGAWSTRQVTTGRHVEVELAVGSLVGMASGVDPDSGALLVASDGAPRAVESGEVVRCRVVTPLARARP